MQVALQIDAPFILYYLLDKIRIATLNWGLEGDFVAKSIVEKLNLKKYKKKAVLHLPEGADYFHELKDYHTIQSLVKTSMT